MNSTLLHCLFEFRFVKTTMSVINAERILSVADCSTFKCETMQFLLGSET